MKVTFKKRSEVNPESSKGIGVSYGPGKRAFPQLRWIIVLIAATSPIHLFVLHSAYKALRIEGRGIITTETRSVPPLVDGVLDTIMVNLGSWVDSGQVLFLIRPIREDASPGPRFKPDTLEATIEVQEQKRSLSGIDRRIVLAKRELALTNDRLSNVLWLQRRGAATDAEVQTARLRKLQSETSLEELLVQKDMISGRLLDMRKRSAFKPEIDTSDATRVIRSTVSGRILAVNAQIGRPVRADEPIVLIEKFPQQIGLQVLLDPKDMQVAVPGKDADVTLPYGKKRHAVVLHTGMVVDSTINNELDALRKGERQLRIHLQMIDSIPIGLRIPGLPVTVSFWRYWD